MGKDGRKKVFFLNFFGQKLLTWISPKKFFCGVFELPLMRNAQKQNKKVPTYPIFSGHLPDIRHFQFLFIWRRLHLHQGGEGDFSAAEIATPDAVYEIARGQRMRKKQVPKKEKNPLAVGATPRISRTICAMCITCTAPRRT